MCCRRWSRTAPAATCRPPAAAEAPPCPSPVGRHRVSGPYSVGFRHNLGSPHLMTRLMSLYCCYEDRAWGSIIPWNRKGFRSMYYDVFLTADSRRHMRVPRVSSWHPSQLLNHARIRAPLKEVFRLQGKSLNPKFSETRIATHQHPKALTCLCACAPGVGMTLVDRFTTDSVASLLKPFLSAIP